MHVIVFRPSSEVREGKFTEKYAFMSIAPTIKRARVSKRDDYKSADPTIRDQKVLKTCRIVITDFRNYYSAIRNRCTLWAITIGTFYFSSILSNICKRIIKFELLDLAIIYLRQSARLVNKT